MENKEIKQEFEIDENNVLVKYNEIEGKTKVIIPNNVVEIGSYAFSHSKILTDIILPTSMVKIGTSAFDGCTNLVDIIFPNGIKEIGNFAFNGCINLSNIVLPNSLITIGMFSFANCTNLKSIILPDNMLSIGIGAFSFLDLKEINLYSYNIFSLLDDYLKLTAILSTIKNYYTGKIQYTDEDMNLFKEYIRKNKIKIFEYIKENKEIINIILNDMDNFLTLTDIYELLMEVRVTEINTMLLEYTNKIKNETINSLDSYNLENTEEDNSKRLNL